MGDIRGVKIYNTTPEGKSFPVFSDELREGLAEIPTLAIVEELLRREGVRHTQISSEIDIEVRIEGPATMLIV